MINIASLPRVRSERELRHVPLLPERVQNIQIGVDIVHIVVVSWVLLGTPLFGRGHLNQVVWVGGEIKEEGVSEISVREGGNECKRTSR